MQLTAPELTNPTTTVSPAFLLGIMARSGTNYLHDLIRLHPDCTVREPIWEDCILYHATPLIQYVDNLSAFWKEAWNIKPEEVERLYKCLGDGLAAFLNLDNPGKRVVSKTPTVGNLSHYLKFFPNAPLLIIVRDGRAVVESAGKTFDVLGFEMATRIWADNAREILRFLHDHADGQGTRYLLIKYEDLVQNVRAEMTKVLNFLGFELEQYDFDAAENLPVRGSSSFRGDKKQVHWDPVKKSAAFNPLQRYSDWSATRHQRFNWLAGTELVQLGYEKMHDADSLGSRLRNRVLDAKWQGMGWLKRNRDAVLRRLGRVGKWVK